MQTLAIIGIGVVASGAWLRWAVTPVRIAYRIGRYTGQSIAAKQYAAK